MAKFKIVFGVTAEELSAINDLWKRQVDILSRLGIVKTITANDVARSLVIGALNRPQEVEFSGVESLTVQVDSDVTEGSK